MVVEESCKIKQKSLVKESTVLTLILICSFLYEILK